MVNKDRHYPDHVFLPAVRSTVEKEMATAEAREAPRRTHQTLTIVFLKYPVSRHGYRDHPGHMSFMVKDFLSFVSADSLELQLPFCLEIKAPFAHGARPGAVAVVCPRLSKPLATAPARGNRARISDTTRKTGQISDIVP
jgi:hypothetical protein